MSNGIPNEPVKIVETTSTVGLTMRDLLLEVRTNTQNLRKDFDDFKGQVVLKTEYNLAEQAKRTTIRWAIATMVSTVSVATAIFVAIINIYPIT